jgi:oligopeptide transport system ATP-binding protein
MNSSSEGDCVLRVENLVQSYPGKQSGFRRSIDRRILVDISFELRRGEALGLVGESGSGKSTLARTLVQLQRPKSGSIWSEGKDLVALKGRALSLQRSHLQMVFQDPFSSMNQKWRVEGIVAEPLIGFRMGNRRERRRRVHETLELVGLHPGTYGARFPRELSGGQCQRVAIARALATKPAAIILDEAVSSLDVLAQAQILDLLENLRTAMGLSLLFISHDMGTVRQVCDRVAILYRGQLCELASCDSIFETPRHPYTSDFLGLLDPYRDAIPVVRGQADSESCFESRAGEPDSEGCRYFRNCKSAQERCLKDAPALRSIAPDHQVACHYPVSGSGRIRGSRQMGTVFP